MTIQPGQAAPEFEQDAAATGLPIAAGPGRTAFVGPGRGDMARQPTAQ